MSHFARACVASVLALVLIYVPQNTALGQDVEGGGGESRVTLLAEDTSTRGDWLGVYGSQAYLLCGVRSPSSLYGGPAWSHLNFDAATGDPREVVRAWQSTAPAKNDRSVLIEPNGLRRTPGVYDDHGEVRPLGQGPDLHVKLDVPAGARMVSLYFFEIDWPQYRSLDVRVYERKGDRLLVSTRAEEFFKGKYVRFAVAGPMSLRIVIARDLSPNAVLAGLFLDAMPEPPLGTLGRALGLPVTPGTELATIDVNQAEMEAVNRLESLLGGGVEEARIPLAMDDYLTAEYRLAMGLCKLRVDDAVSYCRTAPAVWKRLRARVDTLIQRYPGAEWGIRLRMLGYAASVASCDFEAAPTRASLVADLLVSQVRDEDSTMAMERLDNLARELLAFGRRADALPVLTAYTQLCADELPGEQLRERLTELSRAAMEARATRPLADAFHAYEDAAGEMRQEDILLMANLDYLAGKNARAASSYARVAERMPLGSRHCWVMIAEMTALLRSGRARDGLDVLARIKQVYVSTEQVDEAVFRVGVHFFQERDYETAAGYFSSIVENGMSEEHRKMSKTYLGRIRKEIGTH